MSRSLLLFLCGGCATVLALQGVESARLVWRSVEHAWSGGLGGPTLAVQSAETRPGTLRGSELPGELGALPDASGSQVERRPG
jgi:hypothetical protein